MTTPARRSILVTGDLILDRHIYEGERSTLQDEIHRGTHLVEEPGGAALTARLIEAVLAADFAERRRLWEDESKRPDSKKKPEPARHACALGCELSRGARAPWPDRLTAYAGYAPHAHPNAKVEDRFWRVSNAFGYGWSPNAVSGTSPDAIPSPHEVLTAPADAPARPDVLVLDDAGDRFRHKDNAGVWHLPPAKHDDAAALPRWIVLKLAGSIGRGDLWDRLMTCQPEQRLIVLVPATLLRHDDVRLSTGLSWERTAEHFRSAWETNPALAPLRRACHVIVTFEGDGALWVNGSDPAQPCARLVFDPANAEGEWGSRVKGAVFGDQTAMVAAVAQTLVSADDAASGLDLQPAIAHGLSAMRNLRAEGHGIAVSASGGVQRGTGFPVARLAGELLRPSHRFARADVPWASAGTVSKARWSILASLQHPGRTDRPLYGFARQLASSGEAAVEHVPHLRIGSYLTADRDEIESLRSLRRIVAAYYSSGSGKKPLSIGVFGAPGSGKSFAVEQLAIGLLAPYGAKAYDGWMPFNLSQFNTPADLIGAFHQVRDCVLRGVLPVVFWDEFDAGDCRWLQYLLAPMQDGRFQEGQVTHTLGKCVFVFAGGTSASFEAFGPTGGDEASAQRFVAAKGPDFKSRLDGYLNVVGPNPRDETDAFFPVRRALLIRNFLGCKAKERLSIDTGLLTALLEVPSYRHGSRSLGKILEPLSAARAAGLPLRRSQLAAPGQLAIHLDDVDGFHALCARDLRFKADEVVEKLAPAIHRTWRERAHEAGWAFRYDMDYTDLPPDIRRSNVAAARRIPDILALVGLQVVEGASTAETEKVIRDQLQRHLEALAEEEHKGWMAHLEAEGWHYAEARDDEKRLHDCLLPFQALREADKEKDRDSVRHFPDFVRLAGFKIDFM